MNNSLERSTQEREIVINTRQFIVSLESDLAT